MSELLCDFPELKIFIENLMQNRFFQYPLNLDVVNLTLILRAVGFEINSFDFKPQNPEILTPENLENTITIEVCCQKSGLFSKLNLKSNTCECPPKVLPKKNENAVNEVPSNILPDVDASVNSLTNLFLGFLINLFKREKNIESSITPTSTKQIEIKTRTITKEKQTIKTFGNSPFPSISGVFKASIDSDASSTASPFSTPLSSLNITPTESSEPISVEAKEKETSLNDYIQQVPKITLNDITLIDAPSTSSAENDNFNSSFLFMNEETENDSDTYIIKRLVDAREKIDEALIYIKLQNPQEENVTPKNKKGLNKRDMPIVPVNSINRRNSIGSVKSTITSKVIPVKPAVPSKLIKPISKVGPNQTSANKKDTPRPGLMFRSPSSITVANNKNTTAIIKPNPISRTRSKPILAVSKIAQNKK